MANRGELNEADEIKLSEVPSDKLKILKIIGLKPKYAFKGVHGLIIGGDKGFANRFDKKELATLMKHKEFRWLGVDNSGSITIG